MHSDGPNTNNNNGNNFAAQHTFSIVAVEFLGLAASNVMTNKEISCTNTRKTKLQDRTIYTVNHKMQAEKKQLEQVTNNDNGMHCQ